MIESIFLLTGQSLLPDHRSLHDFWWIRIGGPSLVCARHRDAANQNRRRRHPCLIDNKEQECEGCRNNVSVGLRHARSTAFVFYVDIFGNYTVIKMAEYRRLSRWQAFAAQCQQTL